MLAFPLKRHWENHGDGPLVATMTIDQCVIKHILADTGSSVNVLFMNTFTQMGISCNCVLPYAVPLFRFSGQTTKSKGKITLPVSVNDTAHMVEFFIVAVSSPYNCIMGCSALDQFHARISIADLFMEFPLGKEVYVIYGDQKATQEYYFATVKEVEKAEDFAEHDSILKLETDGEYELFVLDNLQLDRIVHIGRNLPIDLRMRLSELLVEFKDIFAWSSFDLGIIPRYIVEH